MEPSGTRLVRKVFVMVPALVMQEQQETAHCPLMVSQVQEGRMRTLYRVLEVTVSTRDTTVGDGRTGETMYGDTRQQT